eukprot:CAMPEP_0170512278 /NCGR_PEP_ID=MMETSP0208-20121228/66763_1 /TAXON_ID=197538 /ORGANISM="Strombidium inclinatum, Strain S3" /LENGTH=49 /DNA_ID=CAMNT_0010795897 /DNA_START=1520 /DNA_END=1669 /DNA_ORIENTATION=+
MPAFRYCWWTEEPGTIPTGVRLGSVALFIELSLGNSEMVLELPPLTFLE